MGREEGRGEEGEGGLVNWKVRSDREGKGKATASVIENTVKPHATRNKQHV